MIIRPWVEVSELQVACAGPADQVDAGEHGVLVDGHAGPFCTHDHLRSARRISRDRPFA